MLKTPVARTDAEHEEDVARMCAIGKPHNLTAGRPGRVEQPLEFQGGQDIRVRAVAVLLQFAGVKHIVAHRHHHRPHLPDQGLFLWHEKIYRLRLTRLHTTIARQIIRRLIETVLHINQVSARRRLGDGRVDGLAGRHA